MIINQRITELAQTIGAKIKDIYTKMGSLSALTTTNKTTLVAAINEVKATAGVQINDTTPSASTTFSSNKINTSINDAKVAIKQEILGTATSAWDTLGEIQVEFGTNQTATNNLVTAVGNRVRFDAAQTLSAVQKTQACTNIGVGEPDTDFVSTFNSALV